MAEQVRSISVIAQEIKRDWKKVNYAAVPYLNAMLEIESINSPYGQDSSNGIVRYFLSNAGTWRGEVARRVKKELNQMV